MLEGARGRSLRRRGAGGWGEGGRGRPDKCEGQWAAKSPLVPKGWGGAYAGTVCVGSSEQPGV